MDQKLLTDFRSELLDSRFGAKAISTIAESKRFPLHEMRDDVAFQIINDELYLDGNARQNLATFCQTWDDENVHKLMDLSINKNWIDKEEYPQSAAIDLRCVNMVADLWHAPAPKNGQAVGTNTIGSSEACMLGGMAMKWRWRKRMEAAGKPTDKPNLVCGPVQICWHKFARYWDVELREIPKNWIDKEEYPQSAAIDLRCVNMVADLWHAPAPKNGQAVGTNTIGSSEACMLGGMAMKWRWRKRMEAAGKPTDKPNLVCGPVQICWHKFARYWDVELREIPMRPGQLFMDPKRMIEACDENTIGVVPTFGVTYTGNYEFPQPLHDALDKFQADTGIDIDMHIDAASGGFLAPFVAPDIVWDFRLPRVKSISASGHKFGLAPLGCGWVIWRDEEALPQELVFNVDYLGGQIGTFAINFSRPAGQVIAQYYEFLRLGREGYTKVQNASYQVAAYLADEIAKLGPYEFICTGRPDEGIPAVCFKLKDGEDPGYTLYDLSERLRLRGWQVPAFTLGGEATDIVVMRIMCRRGFEMDFAELLLEDYKASLKYLSDHPKLQGIAQQNSFKHT
ncbi:glutamate decarboxylase [Escherichia coli]|nr:glutamate decarboxylase [Escherichia coli]MBL3989266.1 glutamate decarboxylase [Escherichia coli]MBO2896624.1 glutamate decarboxylase [Escherichia coli]